MLNSPIKAVEAIYRIAAQYPETEAGTSCNKVSFKAGKKAFLFVGVKDDSYNVMLKLSGRLAEAARLAKEAPKNYSVGSTGWVTMNFGLSESPPAGVMERWIDESYRLIVPKRIVAQLDGAPAARSTRPAQIRRSVKKPAAKKK